MVSRAENVTQGVKILGSRKNKNTLTELRKRFEKTEECLDKFWELWRTEYLNCLRERYQREHRQGKSLSRRVPRIGEIVLLKDEDSPRGHWRLARIIELPKGVEGKIRTAKIFLSKDIILDRPINHLYPLEIPCEENEEGGEMNRNETIVSCAVIGDKGEVVSSEGEGSLRKGEFLRKLEGRGTPNGDVPSSNVKENEWKCLFRMAEPITLREGNEVVAEIREDGIVPTKPSENPVPVEDRQQDPEAEEPNNRPEVQRGAIYQNGRAGVPGPARGRGRNMRYRWQRGDYYRGRWNQAYGERGRNRGRRGRGRGGRFYGGGFSAQLLRVMVEAFGGTSDRGFF